MDILVEKPVKINVRKQIARRLVDFTRQNFHNLLKQWEDGMRLLWSNHIDENGNVFGPRATLAALGKDAKDLFIISAGLRDYLESLKPGCTVETLQKYYKPVDIHSDGTVTLSAPPTPESPV